jgi:DNA-directed RNA polymerase subunit L
MSKKVSKPTKSTKSSNLKLNDIKVNILEHKPFDSTYNNYLVLEFKGQNLNNVIMNTLRRTIMELVPTYAFDKKDIDIIKNTSIYNNDYMRLRLSQFPVVGINNDFKTIERYAELEYEANISTFDKKVEDLTILEKKHQDEINEKAQNFTMSINVKNIASDVKNVTTLDARFYYKGGIIESPYVENLLIIKLKSGEEFNCTAISSLNIGLKEANFMPTSVCTFGEMESNDSIPTPTYKFNIESLKQMSEKEIIIRACAIIIMKLENLKDVFETKISEYKSEKYIDDYNLENNKLEESNDSESMTDSAIRNSSDDVLEQHRIKGIITIENESHTFGNLLSRLIQDHPSILFAGYKIDHLLIKELTLGYKTDGTDIIIILDDIITKAIEIYNEIKINVESLDLNVKK